MLITIYKYTNKINNKVYVGQTRQNLKQRAKKDGKGYKHCIKFYNSIKKYGFNNFDLDILELVDSNEADDKEKYYIHKYDSINNGYNIDFGGHVEKVRSSETKNKISKSGLGTKNSRARIVFFNEKSTNMCIREYANMIGMSESTLKCWCIKNKNGYSYK